MGARGAGRVGFGAAKVAFVANTVIDTVEMAVQILLKGFTDWAADCEISGPSIRDYIEECEITGSREQSMGWWGTIRIPIIECRRRSVLMALDWGRQKCWIRLMGQQITLFDFNFGSLEMTWPAPIETAIDIGTGLSHCGGGNIFTCLSNKILNHITWPDKLKKVVDGRVQDLLPSQMRILAHIGWELQTHCHTHNHVEMTKCLARSLAKYSPPVDFLPDPLKKVANGQVLDLLPDQVKLVAGSAYEAVRTVFSVGWELMHCPRRGHHHDLIRCLGGWVQHLAPAVHWMAVPLQAIASGDIMGLLPGQLKDIASGDIMKLLPKQFDDIASGNIMGLLPGPLKNIADGDIMGLLPGQLNQIASGDIMGLLPGQLNQIASGNIMGLMPGPMQLLGGGQPNSIQNMLTLGNALMKCSDSQQQDLVQCLGFQIVGSVPPLNFLNRLGDIFGEFIAAFAKVASTVAAQAMKGGESLLQTAATTEFPSAGAQAMVHHRGQELTTPN